MYNPQLQQQQLQQQQLLQIQQLLQQSPPQAPLPMAVGRGLPQVQPAQPQLVGVQGNGSASLLSGPLLQRALLLQQLQGLDQFAVPAATYDSTCLTMPTAALGNLRGYGGVTTPNLGAPSLSPTQLATQNLQQLFPQATRQSLLGPPPIGLPMNTPQLSLSGRTPQKQARTPFSTIPSRKTMSVENRPDPAEGSEEAAEAPLDMCEGRDSLPCPDTISREKRSLVPDPEPREPSEPAAKRSKSLEEPTEPGPPGQLKAKVQPQARMTALKQTQTPELLPEPVEARGPPHFQPQGALVNPGGQPRLQKQAQTQTSPEHVVPQPKQPLPEPQKGTEPQSSVQPPKEAEPQKQVQASACSPPPRQVELPLLKQAQTQTCPQVLSQAQPRPQPREQPSGQTQTQPEGSVPALEQAPLSACATLLEMLPEMVDARGDMEEPPSEPAGAQDEVEESQQEPACGLDMGECERRAREMLGTWGTGGSLKVTILQSSDSRAFSTTPLLPGPRAAGDTSTAPVATSTPAKPGLQFFCYICKASCSSQQDFQDHMAGAPHQQRLGDMQHASQACLLSLLPVPRNILEREEEEPPPRRWCHTCQVYYFGDLIQHRRTQDHKIAKQSLRPFCTACNRYFRTPRKFVEHVKSQGHKDKAKELKSLEKELAGQDEDHFITVDAVGCFEGDEEEEEDEDEEEDIEVEEEFCKQVRSRDISIEEWKDSDTYNPNTAYGVDFLVPVMGYVCRICHKFYHSNSGAQLSHCKSKAHFDNLQKYKATKNPSPTSRPMSRRCAINARNALTALFTTGGRQPVQPSTQDVAKTPSKVTAQPPQPPPRRSSRLKS
ncbi:cip1-interacting zinc finger protein isoform X3 [Ochotona princeps]|uniref:cip1-interacting zinc finger protein isoform X3 n=1 Tax=Ochotona princeps TaxID=9978 RepID=UPI0027148FAA|nr:cip1-interacting zinc finger protein isoform X3 [Ochotona princeps]